MKKLIAPSILAANILTLQSDISEVLAAGAKVLHIDIMDGSFVPAITFGGNVVAGLRKITDVTLDVHLMIENPQNHIEMFANAGADIITVHYESIADIEKLVRISKEIRSFGVKSGIAINPQTPVSAIIEIIEQFDLVLIMSVVAGLGGQKYIGSCTEKITEIAEIARNSMHEILIEVDGGVNAENIHIPASAGADLIVAGSAIFGADDIAVAFAELENKL